MDKAKLLAACLLLGGFLAACAPEGANTTAGVAATDQEMTPDDSVMSDSMNGTAGDVIP